ncbi:MAG: ABC transporter ATP-binding protein [Coriobacteriia bacterium]|nr:ABC transporter ATP-binding protein [Coriobacteriia bacterium]
MTRGETALLGEGLRKAYGKNVVVDVDRVEARSGTTLAIVGPSGAGKSTLLGLLGLLEKPDAGRVLLRGQPVDTRDRASRMRFAAAFQSAYLFKGTVADNVGYGLRLRGVRAGSQRGRISAVLERVGLGGWEDRSALTLSGGEAQRVALARALVLEPEVLFLDEPLASLDPLLKGRLATDFARIIREDGVTTVYVTHDQNEAVAIADDMAVMREGRIVSAGPVEEVMGLPVDDWTAVFLGAQSPLVGTVLTNQGGLLEVDVGEQTISGLGSAPAGAQVMLGVRPEDVTIFEAEVEIPRSSARNLLPAKIVEVELWGVTNHVVLDIGGQTISARVTRSSLLDMALEPGLSVQALFKASAVLVRESLSHRN